MAGAPLIGEALLFLLATPYYVGLTGERLVFAKVSRLTSKRSTPAFDYPRASVTVKRFRRGVFWTKLHLLAPDRKLFLRVARSSRGDAQVIAEALGGG